MIDMIATIINVVLILAGSLLGLVFKNRIKPQFSATLTMALGLCVLGIGISNVLRTSDSLSVV